MDTEHAQQSPDRVRGRLTVVVCSAATLCLSASNLALLAHSRTLRIALHACETRDQASLEVKPGTSVPPVEGFDLSGAPVRFDFQSGTKRTLVLVFSPYCFCYYR